MDQEVSGSKANGIFPQDEINEPRASWNDDIRNPRNWSLWRKTAMTAIVSGIGFVW